MANFLALKDDGSTASGNWIYSGCYPGPDERIVRWPAGTGKTPGGLGLYSGWSWCWPVNRRIIYNRCSADTNGQPWSKAKNLVQWDPVGQKWIGDDVPRLGVDRPGHQGGGAPEESAKAPYIMLPEGKARLFVPKGFLREGPFPEHYEALEGAFPIPSLNSSPIR